MCCKNTWWVKCVGDKKNASPKTKNKFIFLIESRKRDCSKVPRTAESPTGSFLSRVCPNKKPSQREEIFFGNGSKTKYFYDAKTFRLVRILTTRNSGADILQDINYTYDAVGNISYIYDDAQQTFYFDNTIINPENDYTYDALYRLIEATGRENFNNVGYYEETTPQALGGNDVQIYTRYFEYDLVGNLTKMQHDASANAFTKHLHYDNGNNNLSSVYIGSSPTAQETFTYDVHGNLLGSRGQVFTYNFLDQLCAASYDDIVDTNDWQSYYQYDAQGQRTRKVVVLDNGTVKERLYIGSYERYREVDSAFDLIVERITLQVTDGEKAVAMLDTETGDSTMYRYQYGNNLGSVGLELDHDAEIISYEEYYPFGGTSYYAHDGALDVPKKRYKYCGKEQDEETGLYYYGARYYLPWLCRFASVDPKALEYVFQSSYAYAVNNPIRFIDVNGEGVKGDEKEETKKKAEQGGNGQQQNKKTKKTEGHKNAYYKSDGTFLGYGTGTDNEVYIADSVTKNKDGTLTFKNAVKIDNITHTKFATIANIIMHESSGDKLESFWIAHTANNAVQLKAISGQNKSLYSLLMNPNYSTTPSSAKTPLNTSDDSSKANNARAAVLDVMKGGADPTGGAVLWDGTDFLAWGTDHNKFKEYGSISIDSEHLSKYIAAQKG